MKKAIVLLSGGLDSITTLAIARRDGFEPCALSFDYGQRHKHELDCARRIADAYRVLRTVCRLDLFRFGGSSLVGDGAVPKGRDIIAGIPNTYVPARNTVFLSHALAWAETLSCADIYLGVNAVDYSGYPDCRPEYIAAFERVANLATKACVEGRALRIHTPLIAMSKADIIRTGLSLGVDYSLTSTCYDPRPVDGRACGLCDACTLRLKGFADVGCPDPVPYV